MCFIILDFSVTTCIQQLEIPVLPTDLEEKYQWLGNAVLVVVLLNRDPDHSGFIPNLRSQSSPVN